MEVPNERLARQRVIRVIEIEGPTEWVEEILRRAYLQSNVEKRSHGRCMRELACHITNLEEIGFDPRMLLEGDYDHA